MTKWILGIHNIIRIAKTGISILKIYLIFSEKKYFLISEQIKAEEIKNYRNFKTTLEKAKKGGLFEFLFETDDPEYWCSVRSEEIWILRCSKQQKKKKKKSCDRFSYRKARKAKKKAERFCEGEIIAKKRECKKTKNLKWLEPTCMVV